ncbi:AAEL014189-PA, partial [Aedes aegypti]
MSSRGAKSDGRSSKNDAGGFVDLYCPRKCSSSKRIIHAKDHALIQINIVDVNPVTGRMLETSTVYAICDVIRRLGESDDCIVRLAKKNLKISKNM